MAGTAAIIGAVASTASAANSIAQSRRANSAANNAADRSDPFAGMRPEFQDMLRTMFPQLISLDPNDIQKDPQFQFQRDQGLQAVDNMASSQGLTRSGNHEQERIKFASGLAGQFANDRFNHQMSILGLLGKFAGVDTGSPAAAGNAIQQGQINSASQFNAGMNAFGGSMANWSNIINNWNSAGGGGYGGTIPTGGG